MGREILACATALVLGTGAISAMSLAYTRHIITGYEERALASHDVIEQYLEAPCNNMPQVQRGKFSRPKLALYDEKSNTIFIDHGNMQYYASRTSARQSVVTETIRHEVGHACTPPEDGSHFTDAHVAAFEAYTAWSFYLTYGEDDEWHEKNIWRIEREFAGPLREALLIKTLSEGVATHLESLGKKAPSYDFANWPTTPWHITNQDVYEGGHALVHPIVSEYRRKGVDMIWATPPEPEDFSNPTGYQKRVLEALAGEHGDGQ